MFFTFTIWYKYNLIIMGYKKAFLFFVASCFLMLSGMNAVSAYDIKPVKDSINMKNNAIIKDSSSFSSYTENPCEYLLIQDDPIISMLDSLTSLKYFESSYFTKDTSILNIYNFPADFTPQYPDSVYKARIEKLNAQTPIKLVYNDAVKNFIDLYAVKKKKVTSRILGLSELYFPFFEEQLDKYGLPLELKYLAVIESALNPTAKSRAGACGLWQFMYKTGKLYGLNNTSYVDDRFDPYKSTVAACEHMKDLYNIYNDWFLVLAAYNSGAGNVNKAIRRSGGKMNFWEIKKYLPRETNGYVPAFIAVNYIMNYYAEHNIFPTDPCIMHYETDTVHINQVVTFAQISEFLNIPIEDIQILNPAYKKSVIPATSEKTCTLTLPKNFIGNFINNEAALYQYKTKEQIMDQEMALKEAENLEKIKYENENESFETYTVKKGDALGIIANRYKCTVQDIKEWNNLTKTIIRPGQKLIVRSKSSCHKSKDTVKTSVQENGTEKKPDSTKVTVVKKDTADKYYIVKNGDALSIIAHKYHCSVTDLKEWNKLKSTTIRIGQKLIVQKLQTENINENKETVSQDNAASSENGSKKPEYYIIQKDDTLWSIAEKYNIDIEKLKKINNITNENKIKPGQKIKIDING